MTLQQFTYVVEIEKTRSFTWAADNLFMSQPNLSRSIRELEKNLGFEIFQRTSRGMVPTQEGAELIERAKRILFQVDSINEIGLRKQQQRQTFGISVPHLSYVALALRQFIADLDSDRPIDIDYCETDTLQAIENVREQRHTLAVVRYKSALAAEVDQLFEDHLLVAEKICESESLILISKQHPLAGYDCIEHEMLAEFVELKYRDNPLVGRGSIPLSTSDRTSSEKQAVIYSHGSQFDLLSGDSTSFMWSTPLPADILEREHLVLRPCTQTGERYVDVLVSRSSYSFSLADECFITHLKSIAKSVKL